MWQHIADTRAAAAGFGCLLLQPAGRGSGGRLAAAHRLRAGTIQAVNIAEVLLTVELHLNNVRRLKNRCSGQAADGRWWRWGR